MTSFVKLEDKLEFLNIRITNKSSEVKKKHAIFHGTLLNENYGALSGFWVRIAVLLPVLLARKETHTLTNTRAHFDP